jgi:hypothetical protein
MASTGGSADNSKTADERVAIYLTNDSVQKITISELRFSGVSYTMSTNNATLSAQGAVGGAPGQQEYVVVINPGTLEVLNLAASQGELQPGQTVTIVLGLDQQIKIGRDTQFNLKTTNGNVVVGTINIGQQSG